RAFFDANPRLRPGMMAVACRRNVLEEVRICLTKDLRGFRGCPEVVRASCRSQQISVPPPL
ncbi:MAG TPA: ribonuclease T, partial [Beijerinckiaceae bacterium]|nr:ribonuclease T [Beijerinckiaceae bacterium]